MSIAFFVSCESPFSCAHIVFFAEYHGTQEMTRYDIDLVAMAAWIVIHFPIPKERNIFFMKLL